MSLYGARHRENVWKPKRREVSIASLQLAVGLPNSPTRIRWFLYQVLHDQLSKQHKLWHAGGTFSQMLQGEQQISKHDNEERIIQISPCLPPLKNTSYDRHNLPPSHDWVCAILGQPATSTNRPPREERMSRRMKVGADKHVRVLQWEALPIIQGRPNPTRDPVESRPTKRRQGSRGGRAEIIWMHT